MVVDGRVVVPVDTFASDLGASRGTARADGRVVSKDALMAAGLIAFDAEDPIFLSRDGGETERRK